jgi:hypothetical protein
LFISCQEAWDYLGHISSSLFLNKGYWHQ